MSVHVVYGFSLFSDDCFLIIIFIFIYLFIMTLVHSTQT